MYQYLNEDAVFERLESLRREVESSRLMARGLWGWARLLGNLGARAWLLGGLAMQRAPRRRRIPTHHALEETKVSDAA